MLKGYWGGGGGVLGWGGGGGGRGGWEVAGWRGGSAGIALLWGCQAGLPADPLGEYLFAIFLFSAIANTSKTRLQF